MDWKECQTPWQASVGCDSCSQACSSDGGGADVHEHGAKTGVSQPRDKWRAPEEGWAKLNTDGSFNAQSFCGGGGAVLRNSEGVVLAAEARWHEQLPDVITVEALAARDGLLMAVAQGIS
ncbi:reverse transcriptase-like protein, partial [Klebsiella pneumoniae]